MWRVVTFLLFFLIKSHLFAQDIVTRDKVSGKVWYCIKIDLPQEKKRLLPERTCTTGANYFFSFTYFKDASTVNPEFKIGTKSISSLTFEDKIVKLGGYGDRERFTIVYFSEDLLHISSKQLGDFIFVSNFDRSDP